MNRPNSVPDPGSELRYISTAQVATALGVGVTTVKRWVDEGILSAHRTPGGHRKLLLADVMRSIRDGNLPHADLSGLVPKSAKASASDPEIFRHQFLEAVRAADVDSLRAVILGAHRAGIAVAILADTIISPGMVHLGELWAAGKVDVMHEHRVSQACVSALYELGTHLATNAEPNRPLAIGGAPEGDHASLPSELARLVLLECGWNAMNLGPHTPISAFHAAVVEFQPRLVWITVTHLVTPGTFIRDYPAFFNVASKQGVAVAIGGNGLSEQLRSKLPYTTFGDGLSHLAAFAKTLHSRPQRPKRGRPPGSTTATNRSRK